MGTAGMGSRTSLTDKEVFCTSRLAASEAVTPFDRCSTHLLRVSEPCRHVHGSMHSIRQVSVAHPVHISPPVPRCRWGLLLAAIVYPALPIISASAAAAKVTSACYPCSDPPSHGSPPQPSGLCSLPLLHQIPRHWLQG